MSNQSSAANNRNLESGIGSMISQLKMSKMGNQNSSNLSFFDNNFTQSSMASGMNKYNDSSLKRMKLSDTK